MKGIQTWWTFEGETKRVKIAKTVHSRFRQVSFWRSNQQVISKLNPTLLQKHSNLFIYLFIFGYCKTSGRRIFRSILPVGALPECSTTSLIGKRHFLTGPVLWDQSARRQAIHSCLFTYIFHLLHTITERVVSRNLVCPSF